MQRIIPTRICVALTVVLGLISTLFAQNFTASLELEQSTNGLSSWQSVPINAGMIKNGKIDLSAVSSSAFYRMKIVVTPSSGNMITVQGGTLQTTNTLNGTAVSTFQIGKHEVTWDEWLEVRTWAVENGYSDLIENPSNDWMIIGMGSDWNHPVEHVNWFDAVKWCNAKSEKEGLTPVYNWNGNVYRIGTFAPSVNSAANGYRLPTEAEWEWAARGGVNSLGYYHSGSNDLHLVAWFYENSIGAVLPPWRSDDRGTWPVGIKLANELGIHDMSGNVNEWCWDAISNERSYRGGNFVGGSGNCLVSSRFYYNPTDRIVGFGFRLARNSP